MSGSENAVFDPGLRPTLCWLDIMRLRVDDRYQRSLETRASQDLIKRIAAAFDWASFQAVLCAPAGDDWLILDGQHRVAAAKACGLSEVPAVIVAAETVKSQAAAFVRANRDRVAVNQFSLFHARLAADEPEAKALDRLCQAAGIRFPRYPTPADKLKPGETLALAAVQALARRHGQDFAVLAIKAVADAFGQVAGGGASRGVLPSCGVAIGRFRGRAATAAGGGADAGIAGADLVGAGEPGANAQDALRRHAGRQRQGDHAAMVSGDAGHRRRPPAADGRALARA